MSKHHKDVFSSHRAVSSASSGSSASSSTSSMAASSSDDALVLTLSIALGVSLIIVIVLICIYANRNSDKDDCRNSDTQYIDVDVLAQKTESGSGSTIMATVPDKPKPVVFDGPLKQVPYKSVDPAAIKGNNSVRRDAIKEQKVSAEKLVLAATEADPAASKVYKTLTADMVPAKLASDVNTVIIVVSSGCGACIATKKALAGMADSSDFNLLETSELRKLSADLQAKFNSPYIPQFFSCGKNVPGLVSKGPTGMVPAESMLSYVVEQKKQK